MKHLKKTLALICLSIFMAAPALAVGSLQNATTELGTTGAKAGTTGINNLGEVVGMVINVALSLVGLIFLILMVYAGFLWMTARGEEEPVKKAQKIIINSLIGLVIVVSAYAITYLVAGKFQS